MFYSYELFIEDIIDAFLEKISKKLPDGIYCIEKNYFGEMKIIKEEIPEFAKKDIPDGATVYFRDSSVNSNLANMGLNYKVALYNNMKKLEEEILNIYDKERVNNDEKD